MRGTQYAAASRFNHWRLRPSLRATGSRECAPDDRLREAIHLATERKKRIDCFAALAMAVVSRVRVLAARCARVVQKTSAPKIRGRRECRVLAAPARGLTGND